jgi:hypothetical protein
MGWHSFAETDFLGDYVSREDGFIDSRSPHVEERESINPPAQWETKRGRLLETG